MCSTFSPTPAHITPLDPPTTLEALGTPPYPPICSTIIFVLGDEILCLGVAEGGTMVTSQRVTLAPKPTGIVPLDPTCTLLTIWVHYQPQKTNIQIITDFWPCFGLIWPGLARFSNLKQNVGHIHGAMTMLSVGIVVPSLPMSFPTHGWAPDPTTV